MNINDNFVLLKRIFYIFILIAGLHFSSNAQVKSNLTKSDLVNNEASKTVKLYPNPATSFVNFEFDKKYDNTYSLVIFNFIGKQVEDLKLSDKKITVSLTNYYRGVYIFQLRDKQGTIVESGKFQVSK